MLEEHLVDLAGEDVGAALNDDILLAVGIEIPAFRIPAREIAREKESDTHGRRIRIRVLVVADADGLALYSDLADAAQNYLALLVHQLARVYGERDTDRSGSPSFDARIVEECWPGFRATVEIGDRDAEFILEFLLCRERGGSGSACHIGEDEPRTVVVGIVGIENGEEDSRHGLDVTYAIFRDDAPEILTDAEEVFRDYK